MLLQVDKSQQEAEKVILYEETIAFIESLIVTQGEGAGEPFVLLQWQKDFIWAIIDDDVYKAALSMARGNGKSAFIAALGVCATVGPWAKSGAQVVIVAGSFDQATIIFEHMLGFLLPWTHDEEGNQIYRDWSITNTTNKAELRYKPQRIYVKVRACNARTAHGIAPLVLFLDEPAQWQSNMARKMLSALETSMGKIGNEKMIAIGTRPDEVTQDGHWYQEWLDGLADVVFCYAADKEDDPLDWNSVIKANPSLDHFPALEKRIRAEQKEAAESHNSLQTFKALRLNMGVSDVHHAVLVKAEDFRACVTEFPPARTGPLIWGVDLGQNEAMSAITAHWPATGWTEPMACFPRVPDLLQRGRDDGVSDLYVEMGKRGELFMFGNRSVDYVELIQYAFNRWGLPDCIAGDRHQLQQLLDALIASGIPETIYNPRGQGYKDGAEDVKRFRASVVDGYVKFHESLLLTSAIGGARVVVDVAGNAKIAKYGDGTERSKNHRDDSAVATVCAVAEGHRWRQAQSTQVEETVERHRGAIRKRR